MAGAIDCPKYYFPLENGTCARQASFFGNEALLSQGVGYSIVLGFGAFFAVFTSFLVPTSYKKELFSIRHSVFLILFVVSL